jgi:predicted permease
MTVRSMARGPEIGVRRAMGAPRGRIIRQLLTESLVLASVGAGVGATLGVWGSGLLVGPLAEQFPNWVSFDLDGRFLGFTLLVTMGAAVLFGLAPALQASRTSIGTVTNRNSASGRRRRGMNMLVTGEVALALALLIVGGLTVLDVQRLGQIDPGFEAEGLVSYQIGLTSERYGDNPARLAFTERYLERLGAVPGVQSAAVTNALPLGGHWGRFYMAEGAPPRAEDEANPVVLARIVSPGYFETLGIEFVSGRRFDDFDGREEGADVVIVNETFVRTHLSHLAEPVGARIFSGTDAPEEDAPWMTVVGVTRDVKHYGLDEEMRPGIYQPLAQEPLRGFQVALETRGDLGTIMSEVRAVTAALDVELPVYSVQTMTEELDESLYTRRAMSWLIGIFSTVALLMAIAGIYGVISYSVGQRSQEISIRMAMGAETGTVLREVVSQGMGLVIIGTVVGLVLSLAGAGVVSRMLVGVSATNPAVYVSVTAITLVVATAANYLPARRAAGLDPMRALRGE